MNLFFKCAACSALALVVASFSQPSHSTPVRTFAFLWMGGTLAFAIFKLFQVRRAWRNFQINEQVEKGKSVLKASFPVLIYGLTIMDTLPWKEASSPVGIVMSAIGIIGAVEGMRGFSGNKPLIPLRR